MSYANIYEYRELYDSTKTKAKQIAEKNKFIMKGTYKSAVGSEIQLNAFNIPKGSIVVTAGAQKLTEDVDYRVDYALGRITILNAGLLESGSPLKVSLENQSLFGFQTKTFLGTNLNYRINDNFNLGGTLIHLGEKPLTQKVNIGDEPVSNTIWGLNTSYRTESQLLTSLVDRLPLIETKEISVVDINAEFAQLIPGQPKIIGRNGKAYVDDFEGMESSIELKTSRTWRLASTPKGLSNLFPEGDAAISDSVLAGYNRAKISWYSIAESFYDDNPTDHQSRRVRIEEIFFKDITTDQITTIPTLNLSYYPNERGPYNYVTSDTEFNGSTIYGLDADGYLKEPGTRWGGLMREISVNDFEESNIEYIKFWLMDPYAGDNVIPRPTGEQPKLIFHLGDISEDVLRDGRRASEKGLPSSNNTNTADVTSWGIVPRVNSTNDAFGGDTQEKDVGLDGLSNAAEQQFFSDYLQWIEDNVSATSPMYNIITTDVSGDDFQYYIDDSYTDDVSVIDRYKNFNGIDQNSQSPEVTGTSTSANNYVTADNEDINKDNTLNQNEAYFHYEVDLRDLSSNNPYIVDKKDAPVSITQAEGDVTWYQFKIPVQDFHSNVNNLEDFSSIRFIRMILTGYEEPITLRFARLELVRSEWRKYDRDLSAGNSGVLIPVEQTDFELSAISIEENGTRYLHPPGIERTTDPFNPQLPQEDEESMVIIVKDLVDNDAKGAYRNISLDMRNYKRLKMEAHINAIENLPINDYDLTAFIRLGSDYTDNYYEYEVPLEVSEELAGPISLEVSQDEGANEPIKQILWPEANKFNIQLRNLVNLKLERNQAEQDNPLYVSKTKPYVKYDENGRKISVVGNPNLADVRTIMIGVRNPGDGGKFQNDGLPKSGEIWINELRLEDFNNDGGWAATARVQTKLADFATVSLAGNTSTPGFGSVDQKVEERQKEQIQQYDISSNIELGKLLPEKAKVNIPMHVSYSKRILTPEYFPFDPRCAVR
jgi:cell surface protein SprA